MSAFAQELVTSVIFIGILLGLRILLIRMVRRNSEILSKEQRRWINRIKNGTIIIAFVCLAMVWAPQLQTFALSLTAFAVALVVATKEMILCLIGSLFRISTRPYKVGDWISMDGVTGEVMEINALSTRLEEIDTASNSYAFTGKRVVLPNSKLFTANVENKNFMKSFVFQDVSAVVQFTGLDPLQLAALLKEVTESRIQPLRDDGAKFARRVSRKAGIDLPDSAPSYGFRTTELGHFAFTARVFVPTQQAGAIATAIAQEFLSKVHGLRVSQEEKREEKAPAA